MADYTVKATPVTKIMMLMLELSNTENFMTKVIWEMTYCNIKNSGNSIMISKIIWDIGKWELKQNSQHIPQWQCMEIQVPQKVSN